MLTVTDQAKAMLIDLRQTAEIPVPNIGFRLSPGSDGRFEIFLDLRRDGDDVVEHEGNTLLLVGSDLSPELTRATMDCFVTPEGPKLVVDRTRHEDG